MTFDVDSFCNNITHNLRMITSDLIDVARRWEVERGKVPFSSYVHVVEYFLRQTDLDLTLVSVKAKGSKILIVFKPPKGTDPGLINRMEALASHSGIKTSSYYTTTLSGEEVTNRRKKDFSKFCTRHGLKPSDYGKEFILDGRPFKIIGCKERKQTYGVICQRVDEPNKMPLVRSEAVVAALKVQTHE